MPKTDASPDTLDINQIKKLIPHRYPFLLIDRIRDVRLGESAVGIKNVTANEPQFQGHFPARPIMPGVMIVEAMAQTAAVLVIKTLGMAGEDLLVYFMTLDKTKFRKVVEPGDQLELHVRALRRRGKVWRFWGEGRVNGQVVAEAEYSAMIVETVSEGQGRE
ncbi:MAG: 3-hydroxyacyl-ACP dehydratase FabZ [Paracoccaceae bacterium]